MDVGLHIPDDIAEQMRQVNGHDIARHILEEYAIRAYQERTWANRSSGAYWVLIPGMSWRRFWRPTVSIGLYTGGPGTGSSYHPAPEPVMRVIADNTPLRYLILLGYVDILPALYHRVIVPAAVVTELQHPKTPAAVRAWMAHPPPGSRCVRQRPAPMQPWRPSMRGNARPLS